MKVRNNAPATRSYRSYRGNTGVLSKNLEKLSSGYKINRSADDAAGLAISEKMRAQITGLTGAQQNAKQGIGLIQTTEGALQEYQEILNRMLELSVESANSTYDDDVDREQLQKELTRLAQELNRISDSTNFNGVYTLNGGYMPWDNSDAIDVVNEIANDFEERLITNNAQTGKIQFSLAWDTEDDLDLCCNAPSGNIRWNQRTVEGGYLDVDAQVGEIVEKPVENIVFDEPPDGDYKVYVRSFSRNRVEHASVRIKLGNDIRKYLIGPIEPGESYDITSFKYSEEPPNFTGIKPPEQVKLLDYSTKGEVGHSTKEEESDIKLLIGETADEQNILEIPRFNMHTSSVGLANVDISTQGGALNAIDKIKSAINKVSDARGTHGALQNRLEHTINYLGNAHENIQDAESVIRDTDMAEEMMKYTKNSILMQSAQSMMAQANMLPEGVLRLMQ